MKEIKTIKLSDWSDKTGVKYSTAWRWFNAGTLPVKAFRTSSGAILVEVEDELKKEANTSAKQNELVSKNGLSAFVKKAFEFSSSNSSISDFVTYVIDNFDLYLKTETNPPVGVELTQSESGAHYSPIEMDMIRNLKPGEEITNPDIIDYISRNATIPGFDTMRAVEDIGLDDVRNIFDYFYGKCKKGDIEAAPMVLMSQKLDNEISNIVSKITEGKLDTSKYLKLKDMVDDLKAAFKRGKIKTIKDFSDMFFEGACENYVVDKKCLCIHTSLEKVLLDVVDNTPPYYQNIEQHIQQKQKESLEAIMGKRGLGRGIFNRGSDTSSEEPNIHATSMHSGFPAMRRAPHIAKYEELYKPCKCGRCRPAKPNGAAEMVKKIQAKATKSQLNDKLMELHKDNQKLKDLVHVLKNKNNNDEVLNELFNQGVDTGAIVDTVNRYIESTSIEEGEKILAEYDEKLKDSE